MGFIQTIGNHNSAASEASFTITPAANVQSGNDIIVIVNSMRDAGVDTFTVTDSASNSYSSDYHNAAGLDVYRAHNVSALTTSQTITVTGGAAYLFLSAVAIEVSNLSASALDKTAAANQAATTAMSSGATATLSQVNEWILGICITDRLDSSGHNTFTAGGSFTARGSGQGTQSGGVDYDLFTEEMTVAATTAVTATGTLGSSAGSELSTTAVLTYKLTGTTVTGSGSTTGKTKITPPPTPALLHFVFGLGSTSGRSKVSFSTPILIPLPPTNYEDTLEIEISARQLRNDVIASGGTSFISQTDRFTADGVAFQWALSYPPDTSAPLVPTLLVNSLARAVGQAGSGAATSPWSVLTISPGYAVLQTGTDGVPASGTALVLSYQYQTEALVRMRSETSIATAVALPNLGVFSSTPRNASGLGLAGAVGVAQSQLTLYANPITTITVVIPEQFTTSGVREGQSIQFASNRLGVSGTYVITEVQLLGAPSATGQRRLSLKLEG